MSGKKRSKNFDNVPEVKTQKKRKHAETKEQLISTLKKTNETKLYSELTPEDFGTPGFRKFKFKNINPRDKSLEFNGKVYQYWNGCYIEGYTEGEGNGLLYCDYGTKNNEHFMVGEFQNGEIQKGFVNYAFCKDIDYEAGEFKDGLLINGKKVRHNGIIEEGEFKDGLLINGKKVRYNGKIEEGEFDNGSLSGGQRTHPNGKIEIVFSK